MVVPEPSLPEHRRCLNWVRDRRASLVTYGLFFCSGLSTLIFETLWTHEFAAVIGGTAVAMAYVFGLFLVFLALGTALQARFRISPGWALPGYGLLEILAGVFASASCLLLLRREESLLAWQVGWPLELSRFVLVSLLVAPAALCMGATFPLMATSLKSWSLPSRRIEALYGINTLGAAVGAFLPGWWLLPEYGALACVQFAFGVNLVIGLAALWLSRQTLAPARPPDAPSSEPALEACAPVAWPWLLVLSFSSGFSVLLLENCWGRLLRFVLGNRALALSVLLAGVLLWLGLASLVRNRVARALMARSGVRDPLPILGLILLLAAGLQAFSLLAFNALLTVPLRADSFLIFASLLVLGAAFFFPGLLFPWLLQLAPGLDEATNRSVGQMHAVNVVGAMLGSLLTGLVFLEYLGAHKTILIAAGLQLVLGLWLAGRTSSRLRLAAGVLGVATGAGLLLTPVPPIPLQPGETVLSARETREGSHALLRTASGDLTVTTNRIRLVAPYGTPNTFYAQHLQADLPMLLAEKCDSVFNLGTGYGITVGAFTLWSQPKIIWTIEIFRFMMDHQDQFTQQNYSYWKDPRVRVLHGDGRRVLLSAREPFDVLSINPLDARLPGSSTMCTVDFWESCRERLNPGGVHVQLAWGSQLTTLAAGFEKVYPNYLAARCYTGSFVLLGWNGTQTPQLHLERLTPAVRQAYAELGILDCDLFFKLLYRQAVQDGEWLRQQVKASQPIELHTKNHPVLEYFARPGDSLLRTDDEP